MTYIKKNVLEDSVKQYIGELSYLGKIKLGSELISAENKDWELYELNINKCRKELEKYTDKAILGEDVTFRNNVFNLYMLLRGAIIKLENTLLPKSRDINLTEIAVSFGFFSAKINVDPKTIEDRTTYINEQIDYLNSAIQAVEHPALFSKIKALASKLTLG